MADTDTRYTKDHEWIRLDGDIATIGITDHAQEALGDVVFVELPELQREVEAGEAWFFKLEIDDIEAFNALLDEAAYNEFLETL